MLSDRIYDGAANTLSVLAQTMQAGGTGATAGAWDTSGHRDAFIAQVQALSTAHDALITRLQALGINV